MQSALGHAQSTLSSTRSVDIMTVVAVTMDFDGLVLCDNKKYVLWNMGICPIASKVGHVTLATPSLGSFIVHYVVLVMAYPTKKQELSYRKQIARQLHKH